MRPFSLLLTAALLALAAALGAVRSPAAGSQVSPLGGPAVPRVRCERPRTLRLHRFEDRSAWLECAGRVLARVSVPG